MHHDDTIPTCRHKSQDLAKAAKEQAKHSDKWSRRSRSINKKKLTAGSAQEWIVVCTEPGRRIHHLTQYTSLQFQRLLSRVNSGVSVMRL